MEVCGFKTKVRQLFFFRTIIVATATANIIIAAVQLIDMAITPVWLDALTISVQKKAIM